jgi:4a-hydroxytetrahydrobiopterin dehydratase
MTNWTNNENSLEKTYRFDTFESAMEFMQQAALKISEADHHPTWTNTYNQIHVSLSTHDAGNKVTQKDKELAAILDQLFNQIS